MKNNKKVPSTKFSRVFQTLTAEERFAFGRYVRQQSLEANSYCTQLLEALTDSKTEKWTRSELFAHAFPQRTYQEVFLRKQFSALFGHLRAFLIQLEWQDDPVGQELAFLRQLKKRECKHQFDLVARRLSQQLAEQDLQDSQQHYYKYQLASAQDRLFLQQQVRRYDPALQTASDELDAFYFSKKLELSCEMHNRSRIVEGAYESRFL
ncbi:MAG: hypothetical protein AAGJ82_12945, partial [Bacteroidota bacterium]